LNVRANPARVKCPDFVETWGRFGVHEDGDVHEDEDVHE
jgi:hypothetical protein